MHLCTLQWTLVSLCLALPEIGSHNPDQDKQLEDGWMDTHF